MKSVRLMILVYVALALSLYRQVVLAEPMSQPSTSSTTRFVFIDVFVDPHGKPLAAYQIEITGEADQIKLAGVEGGAVPAYREAPYYDPAALSQHRIILAALSTDENLPTKQFRAARLHVQVLTPGSPEISVKLITAATPGEQTIGAGVSLEEGAKP